MKILVFLTLLAGVSQAATTLLYTGTARIMNLKSGEITNQGVFLKKTLDSANKLLTEVACVTSPNQPALISPVYMKVDGNKITAISEKSTFDGQLTGTGDVRGEVWNWSYLKFSMLWNYGNGHNVRVEDGNFVVRDLLVARKQIFADGDPVQLWEVQAKATDAATFNAAVKAAGCPSF
jgi:hypothetical protein